MNGYLMQELDLNAGEDAFVESFAPENQYGVVFEDDGETGYFYAVEKDKDGPGLRVLDALHIYEADGGGDEEEDEEPDEEAPQEEAEGDQPEEEGSEPSSSSKLQIVWSRDWLKCALVIDGFCQAIFDFEGQRGYNINEFPPPNDVWTKGARELTDDIIHKFF